MILNKKLWALVDPTDSFIVWGWEEPMISQTKEDLESTISANESTGIRKKFFDTCKIKQVYISIVSK